MGEARGLGFWVGRRAQERHVANDAQLGNSILEKKDMCKTLGFNLWVDTKLN